MRSFFIVLFCFLLGACGGPNSHRVLVFTGTEGFRHGSTEAGVSALRDLGDEMGVAIEVSDSADVFREDRLQRYRTVVFLNTSGDVLNYHQQADFDRFIQAGGGFVGVHAAADTERDWEWYGHLIGAYFGEPLSEYPRASEAVLTAAEERTPAEGVPSPWNVSDEWYRFESVAPDLEVVLQLEDERLPGGNQPAAWRHAFDGGRAFYTALGHTPAVFESQAFRHHLREGLAYALGDLSELSYSDASTRRLPDETRFDRTILADSLNEPTELELLGEGKVLFVERRGVVKLYDPAADSVRVIAELDVHTEFEDGLMGAALDPSYHENNWVYLYYSPAGDEPKQHLSRFVLRDDSLQMDSESVLLVVPTQREECCHTGGSIEFGPDGHLFLSTGDDTNPFDSDGFAPIDERPGRRPFDAQRTSANTNDLRGKILRIMPQSDGTYTIPEGNLFPDGTERTRPEIYVMGNRNPYRIHIDQKTGYLYWGEVGPDAGETDPDRGPRGHDEVNQAREAGFYGWPLFVADNKAYRDYDFATGESGDAFDADRPVNDSPNNDGLRELPPAEPAFIWYPYAASPEFSIVGSGGRNAMAGPVFYSDMFDAADQTFPDYYDGKLFIYDWIRGWVLVATMDASGDLLGLEPFMPSTRWNNPIDMAFDEHGAMYVLEYGTGWFTQNPDARLNRVEYNPGNRAPSAVMAADATAGPAPLTVTFSAGESDDPDGDELRYTWRTGDSSTETERPAYTHTFEEPGAYEVTLTVEDAAGSTSSDEVEVLVGNAVPEVDIRMSGNRSFFWPGRSFEYDVRVRDAEDGDAAAGDITTAAVFVDFDFLEQGYDTERMQLGHRSGAASAAVMEGRRLIDESDCQACHSATARSVGPSYVDVAVRYRDRDDAADYLSTKIVQGGGGVWGEQVMAAHPDLSREEASAMVEYILSLAADSAAVEGVPLRGRFTTDEQGEEGGGAYVLRASYTDSGAPGAPPLTGHEVVVLRPLRVAAANFDSARAVAVVDDGDDERRLVTNIYDGSYLLFEDVDLTDIEGVAYALLHDPLHSTGGRIELRLDRPGGTLISTADASLDDYRSGARTVEAEVDSAAGVHDLYVLFRNDRGLTAEALFMLESIRFQPSASAAG